MTPIDVLAFVLIVPIMTLLFALMILLFFSHEQWKCAVDKYWNEGNAKTCARCGNARVVYQRVEGGILPVQTRRLTWKGVILHIEVTALFLCSIWYICFTIPGGSLIPTLSILLSYLIVILMFTPPIYQKEAW